jgi:hypothetical protein
VPPTLGYEEADGEPIPGVSGHAQHRPLTTALVTTHCWSGAAGAVVLHRAEERCP